MGPVSDPKQKHFEEMKQEEGRLEELLFLIDPTRRPRIQKVLAFLRSRMSSLGKSDPAPATPPFQPTLAQLRQRQSDLEESLFQEAPESRQAIKAALKQVRDDIANAEAVAMRDAEHHNEPGSGSEDAKDTAKRKGPSQVA